MLQTHRTTVLMDYYVMGAMASQEWFEKEKERLEEEVKEHLQEAISNVQILSQNLDHMNDVGNEIVNISAVWVKFLNQVNGSSKDLWK